MTKKNKDYEIRFETYKTPITGGRALKYLAGIIVIGALAYGISTKETKNKIENIKNKIEQIQEKKESAIADSLLNRDIDLTDIQWNKAWNADRSINRYVIQCSNIQDCQLSKLYSKEEIERMDKDLQARRIKRANEMHPGPGFVMGVLWDPHINENTTIQELVENLKYIDPARGEPYLDGSDGRIYELFYPIRFPDKNPNIIVNKEGDFYLTNSNLMLKILGKEQKEILMNSALTLYTAQEEQNVVNDIRDHFCEKAEKETNPLLQELAKKAPEEALRLQKNILLREMQQRQLLVNR